MNEFDLFDAFGAIDEDLLVCAEHQAVRKFPIRKALVAAAAVMLLAVTAMATPTVREWFFGSDLTVISDASITQYHISGTGEDGDPYEYDTFGYQESWGRVDLNLEGIGETPDTIQELRVPTYFDSGNWDYTLYVQFPEVPLSQYHGVWQRWIEKDGEKTGQYIIYKQSVIQPAAGQYPAGYGQFTIDLGNHAPVEQSTLTLDDKVFQVYQVGESALEDLAVFGAHTDVFWSDGEYAYHITTGGMDLDMIEDILRSIAPVKNQRDYIRPAVFDSIETYYTLSVLPEDLVLTNATDNGYHAWQLWGDFERGIDLTQDRVQPDGSDVHNRDLDWTLSDLREAHPDCRVETHEISGMRVSMVWFDDDVYAYWTQDGCDFILTLSGYPDLSAAQISAYITGLVPVEDFDSLTTE